MSQATIENFQRGTAAYNRGDWTAALATMVPDVEFDLTRAAPDGETYRGYEGVKVFWGMLRDIFGDFQIDPDEIIDAGDRLFTRIRLRSTGKASGAATEDILYQVWTVTAYEGEVKGARAVFFRDRADALEAAGLKG